MHQSWWSKMEPAQRRKVVLGGLGLVFITGPAIFATWWYMFSSTPPYQWFRENGFPTMNFPLLWIFVPTAIGFAILGKVLWSIRRENAIVAKHVARNRFNIEVGPSFTSDNTWPIGSVRFLHAKVSIQSGTVHGCRAYLTEIKGQMKNWSGSEQLTFSPSEASDSLSKAIYANVPYLLDVLVVTSAGDVVVCNEKRQWLRLPRLQDLFAAPGSYDLTVLIGGEDAAAEKFQFRFERTGHWQTWLLHPGDEHPSTISPLTPFDVNNAFTIEALAVPDLQNRTERGLETRGKPAWSLDCDIGIRNLHPTQGFDDVRLRILSVTPPMIASPTHHPRTQDSILRRVRYYFSDIPVGKPLLGDQTGHVRIFNATRRKMDSKETAEVCVRFHGTWPDNLGKEFIPQAEHLLTVEVTGSGVGRKEVSFKLSFSTEMDAPVFTVTRLSDIPSLAFRKRHALYVAAAKCLAKAPPTQFAGLKCLRDSGADAAIIESNDDLVWVCDNLVRDGYEHPFYYFDEYIPTNHWLVFLTEARKSGIDFGDEMATSTWFMETHPNAKPLS